MNLSVSRYGCTHECTWWDPEEPVVPGCSKFSDFELEDVEGRLNIYIGTLHSWYTCRYRRYFQCKRKQRQNSKIESSGRKTTTVSKFDIDITFVKMMSYLNYRVMTKKYVQQDEYMH